MRSRFPVLLIAAHLSLQLAGCQPPAPPMASKPEAPVVSAADRAAGLITRASLEEPIRVMAGDDYEGRGTASAGDAKAQEYLIRQMSALGLEPGAGPEGWRQSFDVVGIKAEAPAQWNFTRDRQTLTLQRREQFIAASGVQEKHASVQNAEIWFVGYGIEAPEYQWDDFKGVNLKGKVLLMMNNDPDWDPQLFAGETRLYYGRWMYKYDSAARHGAAGAIIIHTTPSAGYPWQVVQTSWSGEQFDLPAGREPRLRVKTWVTEGAARQLTALGGYRLDDLVQSARRREFRPVNLHIRTSFALENKVERTRTANVLGILPGSDMALRKEAVVYSAHHDHLGIGEPDATGDRIYNGALDNASGMATILSIARAFKALDKPPRRSILFLFPGAEEQGLLGSQYFAEHPTLPAGKFAANLNYDVANNLGRTRDVTVVGYGKTTLDAVVRVEALRQGRTVVPDPFPDRGNYYRSDHFNLAKVGVPGVSMKPGIDFIGQPEGWGKAQVEEYEAKRYHQPGDQLDASWNFDGMIMDAQLGFRVGLAVANAPEMPAWVPGDEFEAVRKRTLNATVGTGR